MDSERGREEEKDTESERRDKRAHLDVRLLVQETLGCCGEAEWHTLRRKRTHHTPSNETAARSLFTLLRVQRACMGCQSACSSERRRCQKKASTPISPHVRTFSTLNQTLGGGGGKPRREIFPPSEKQKSSLYPVKSINNSIQLAPPHPAQLAKALDKLRTSGKRGEKSN